MAITRLPTRIWIRLQTRICLRIRTRRKRPVRSRPGGISVAGGRVTSDGEGFACTCVACACACARIARGRRLSHALHPQRRHYPVTNDLKRIIPVSCDCTGYRDYSLFVMVCHVLCGVRRGQSEIRAADRCRSPGSFGTPERPNPPERRYSAARADAGTGPALPASAEWTVSEAWSEQPASEA